MRRAVVLVFVALGLSACSEPLQFADWRLPIPDGTPIKEYAPVPVEERDPGAVRLTDDLVIGGDSTDPNALFYGPSGVVASEDGTIYVADSGSKRIQAFGPDGEYVDDHHSPEGDFLAAGFVPHTWSYALGDYVCGLRRDEREEMVVVRYRLVLPGEEKE